MARIVVLDGQTVNPGDLPWDGLAALGELEVHPRTAPDEILPRALGADVVVTNKTPLDGATLAKLPGLRGVSVLATGHNVVDGARARALGVPVCNVPAYSTASVAEHALSLLLELTHHVGLHARAVREGEWSRASDFTFWNEPLVELAGKTLGIVGYGAVGQRVGVLGRALGMRVVATPSRRVPNPPEGVEYGSLEVVFETSDALSLHCPLTAETERLVRRERLERMRPGALLVNTARGGLIDEADLVHALEDGTLGGAALDVLSVEPPPGDHPLLRAPRCIVTPHQAWTTFAARRRLLDATVKNVAAILAGRPINVVNA
ncbi:MAG TPA: D-2-hydroxyacid dehydrogenase [Polyangiaceae bacterium]